MSPTCAWHFVRCSQPGSASPRGSGAQPACLPTLVDLAGGPQAADSGQRSVPVWRGAQVPCKGSLARRLFLFQYWRRHTLARLTSCSHTVLDALAYASELPAPVFPGCPAAPAGPVCAGRQRRLFADWRRHTHPPVHPVWLLLRLGLPAICADAQRRQVGDGLLLWVGKGWVQGQGGAADGQGVRPLDPIRLQSAAQAPTPIYPPCWRRNPSCRLRLLPPSLQGRPVGRVPTRLLLPSAAAPSHRSASCRLHPRHGPGQCGGQPAAPGGMA